MTATIARRRSALDTELPSDGLARDSYEVALTALMLSGRRREGRTHHASAHAVTLHRISGSLHRIAERQCNEDLTCEPCRGTGERIAGLEALHNAAALKAELRRNGITCRACGGGGKTTSRREERLEAQAREIAEHYGCRAYFQGHPRGCPLYLIPAEDVPPGVEQAQSDWIDSNYQRGHAVVRLGR